MTFESTPPARGNDTPAPFNASVLFLGAIALGGAAGLLSSYSSAAFSQGIDTTVLVMIFLLLFELRLGSIWRAFRDVRFLTVAWAANFIIIPFIGFGIASLIFPTHPLLFTGLMIYFLAPCTDWFLGFTRLAKGDTELGAMLIPINMITQLLLFPVWLWLFAQATGAVDFAGVPQILFQWFLLPLLAAQSLRVILDSFAPRVWSDRLLFGISQAIPFVLAALVFQLFAAHIGAIATYLHIVALTAVAVCLFFLATYAAGELLSRLVGLNYPQRALLSMTMTARNAPLMLALSAVAIPDQPLILAIIVSGMLVEIPLLTALKQILIRQAPER
ncbi:MAG: arsenic resistance protein [Pseudomonadota bacterium]